MGEVYRYALVAFVFGLLNIVGTTNSAIALLATLFEYGIVCYFIFKKDNFKAFLSFLLFVSVTIEMDTFIYGDSTSRISFNFFQVPLLNSIPYYLIVIYLALSLWGNYKKTKCSIDVSQKSLLRWMIVLFITGFISIIWGMLINDNNIMSSPSYPKIAIIYSLSHIIRLLLIFITVVYVSKQDKKEHIVTFTKGVILGIVFSSSFGLLLGFSGWYGDEEILLTPISIFFAPFLILFFSQKNNNKQWFYLLSFLLIVAISFSWATPIGSKWYILFFLALIAYVIYSKEIKSTFSLVLMGTISVVVLVAVAPFLITLLDLESFMGYKIGQLLGVFNFNNSTSVADWYSGMSNSPLYRFDEVVNTFIEYLKKPGYFLFGKGFGGTTMHHTNLLSWETDPGAFSDDQIKIGAYYALHESIAAVFLRHGIAGIVFLFTFLYKLIKALPYSPWAMCAFAWLFFYWTYGSALILGPVMIILVLSDLSERAIKKSE